MTKWRIFAYAIGGALAVVGALVPGVGALLIPAGASLLGFATRWPQDTPPATPPADK